MQRGGKFSLAGALFDWLVADGYASPDEHAPDTWRAAFEGCADAEVWLGLFSSCRGGRDWAWRTAPSAGLVLDCTVSGRTQAARQQHFHAVNQSLNARGALPTKLTAVCDKDLTRDSSALSAVSGVGAGVVSLHIRSVGLHSVPREGPTTVFLQDMAAACPNTTSITLTHVMCTLPRPTKLPKVTELLVKPAPAEPPADGDQKVPTGIKAYAAQLTSLHLDASDHYWSRLFTGPSPALPKLTHFSSHDLSHSVRTLLLQHAPVLKHVTVGKGGIGLGGLAGGQLGVDTLVMLGALDSVTLANLPARRYGGKLAVEAPIVQLLVGQNEGFQPYLRARFDDVCVTAQRIEITPFESLSEPATALRNAMQQLGCLQVQKGTVAISGWALTRDAARAVADTMPTLPDISIEWCASEALTDQQLRRLLRTVPQLRRLSVPSLNLQSDQHANTPWPWEELAVSECDAAMLLRLPNPGGEGAPRVVRCESITLDANKLNGNTLKQLCDRLQHIQFAVADVWSNTLHEFTTDDLCITCECSPEHQGTWHVKPFMTALRAVPLSDSARQRGVTVTLKGWRLSPWVAAVLGDLSCFKGEIVLEGCDWGRDAEQTVVQLASAIPACYTVVPQQSWPKGLGTVLRRHRAAVSR